MKNKPQFNIVNNRRATTHGDYYTGTLNLSHLSSVLIDGDQAKIDLGLLHAKSAVERGIKFTSKKEEVTDGKWYKVVWVAMDRNQQGPYYAGVTACSMYINREQKRGWKNLAEHVNRMDHALKRRIDLTELNEKEKMALRKLLQENNREMWENSSEELKKMLTTKVDI